MTGRPRSPEAKERRAAARKIAKREAAEKRWEAMKANAGRTDLCRRCWQRPHVPLADLCRACRYYTRGERA